MKAPICIYCRREFPGMLMQPGQRCACHPDFCGARPDERRAFDRREEALDLLAREELSWVVRRVEEDPQTSFPRTETAVEILRWLHARGFIGPGFDTWIAKGCPLEKSYGAPIPEKGEA